MPPKTDVLDSVGEKPKREPAAPPTPTYPRTTLGLKVVGESSLEEVLDLLHEKGFGVDAVIPPGEFHWVDGTVQYRKHYLVLASPLSGETINLDAIRKTLEAYNASATHPLVLLNSPDPI